MALQDQKRLPPHQTKKKIKNVKSQTLSFFTDGLTIFVKREIKQKVSHEKSIKNLKIETLSSFYRLTNAVWKRVYQALKISLLVDTDFHDIENFLINAM